MRPETEATPAPTAPARREYPQLDMPGVHLPPFYAEQESRIRAIVREELEAVRLRATSCEPLS